MAAAPAMTNAAPAAISSKAIIAGDENGDDAKICRQYSKIHTLLPLFLPL